MSIKPILFNTEMVRAILDGQKTVTRRLIKPRYREGDYGFRINKRTATGEITGVEIIDEEECGTGRYVKPPFMPGDLLYVRETFTKVGNPKIGIPMHYEYRADMENPDRTSRGFIAEWRPSIHMPKEAARIWLKVSDVGVERLQDITECEAIDEGMLSYRGWETAEYKAACIAARIYKHKPPLGLTPRERFVHLWDSTIKKSDRDKYGWEANPYVFVISFEKIENKEVF